MSKLIASLAAIVALMMVLPAAGEEKPQINVYWGPGKISKNQELPVKMASIAVSPELQLMENLKLTDPLPTDAPNRGEMEKASTIAMQKFVDDLTVLLSRNGSVISNSGAEAVVKLRFYYANTDRLRISVQAFLEVNGKLELMPVTAIISIMQMPEKSAPDKSATEIKVAARQTALMLFNGILVGGSGGRVASQQ